MRYLFAICFFTLAIGIFGCSSQGKLVVTNYPRSDLEQVSTVDSSPSISEMELAPQSWMTIYEEEFFAALGADTRVGAEQYYRPARRNRLKNLVIQSPPPFHERFKSIVRAKEEESVTVAERQAIIAYFQSVRPTFQTLHLAGLYQMALGSDPLVTSKNANILITPVIRMSAQNESLIRSLELQRKYLERACVARMRTAVEMEHIVANLQSRLEHTRPKSDVFLTLNLTDGTMIGLEGSVIHSLNKPLLHLVVHTNPFGDEWTSTNNVQAELLNAMNLDVADVAVRQEAEQLATVQERWMKLPLHYMAFLPDISAGREFQVWPAIPAKAILGCDRIEAQLLTTEGFLSFSHVVGLGEVKRELMAMLEASAKAN